MAESGGMHLDVLIGWPGGDWQATLRLVGLVLGGYLFVIWLASVLWVYRDIRSRTRDPISQATGVAIAVIFPIVGLPVYMVLRPSETLQEAYDRQLEQEAILSELHSVSACPNCRRPVQDEFMVCPHCATSLKEPCTSCGQLLANAWRHCPYCATAKPSEVRAQRLRAEEREREAEFEAPRRTRAQASASVSAGGATSSRRVAVADDADEDDAYVEPSAIRTRRASDEPAG